MLSLGIGDIKMLYQWYMGIDTFPTYTAACNRIFVSNKDEEKAKWMLDYILTQSCYTTEDVRNEVQDLLNGEPQD